MTRAGLWGLGLAWLSACAGPVEPAPPVAPRPPRLEPLPEAPRRRALVRGLSDDGTSVRLFPSRQCGGPALAQGSAADLAAGLPVTLVDGDNVFTALAVSQAGAASACSAPVAARYTRLPPPAPPFSLRVEPAVWAATTRFVVRGQADPGTTVRAWWVPLASGLCPARAPDLVASSEAFADGGLDFTLAPDTRQTVAFDAVNDDGDRSSCTALTLTSDFTPPTLVPRVQSPHPSPEEVAWVSLTDSRLDEDVAYGLLFANARCESPTVGQCAGRDCALLQAPLAVDGGAWWAILVDGAGNGTDCVAGEPWVYRPGAPVPAVELRKTAFGRAQGRVPASATAVEYFFGGDCSGTRAQALDPDWVILEGLWSFDAVTVSARAVFPDGGAGRCSAPVTLP